MAAKLPVAPPNDVFVFGSNLAGIHGRGAALFAARYRGAIRGEREGLQGSSYAIPTRDRSFRTLHINEIRTYVSRFLRFAADHPNLHFSVTPIGCGLAGLSPEQVAPLFADAPRNVTLPQDFTDVLKRILL